MKVFDTVALLSTVASSWASRFISRASDSTTVLSDATPRRYIVELKSHSEFMDVSQELTKYEGLGIVKELNWDVFPALSIECEAHCDQSSLKATINQLFGHEVVAAVYKSRPMQIPPTVEGESFADDTRAVNYSVHGQTGVDKLHEAGIKGKGALVALVDSGIQYTHPALGGGIGEGFTVSGGFDLVGDSWPATAPEPDNDPYDVFGHGTHCAGIIAGKSEQFTGVAPEANLFGVKVFGSSGYSDEATVIEGFLKAYESGADIISASLGERSGFTTNALAVVASRLVDAGVVVVVAAGNDGIDGPFAASNGASGKHSLTVASAEAGALPANTFNAKFITNSIVEETEIAYLLGQGSFPKTLLDIIIKPLTLNISVESDACSPLPQDTPQLNETVVLVRLGGCTIDAKWINIAARGAQYALFYNTDAPIMPPLGTVSQNPIAVIEAQAGQTIIEAIQKGGNVTASFNVDANHYVGVYNSGAGRPARYSSWGGTYDLALKPDISAPGTRILSSYPTNEFRILSGTSMATPYIAGVAALWVSQFGGRAAHSNDPAWAQRLISRITSTGRAMPWADWSTSDTVYKFWSPPSQVGAGLIDAQAVLGYTTDIGFDCRKIELNDTAHFQGVHTVEITNNGKETVAYNFEIQPAGGYDSWIPLPPGQQLYALPRTAFYSEVELVEFDPEIALPRSLTVKAGQTISAEISFKSPSGANETNIPVYGGKILVRGSNDEELGIPYFGVAASIQEQIQKVFDHGSYYPMLMSGINGITIDQKSNFSFNFSKSAQDFPQLLTRFTWGTEEFRWDIFDEDYTEADWVYPPVIGQNGFVGSATAWNGTMNSQYFDPEAGASENDIYSFPQYHHMLNYVERSYWLGRFANGSQVVPGMYNFRIAALLPFGDPTKSTDWDLWETPSFTVLPKA
ncbi:subtilisin-like protein [Pseudovirgaria hyperparasitica]|uniref:Subtilisin-like protein n=1 Tax=Pseudovirgaria hyperparasitica TaxID=470096 RepID=A0A6A6W6Z9_9PEZI|nr:subtilisin-like protein [Pseudovirgaria hyperparasitica]KAF2757740.1 subtilisin-like protein [Pseudovirgaria hyperparasitica]